MNLVVHEHITARTVTTRRSRAGAAAGRVSLLNGVSREQGLLWQEAPRGNVSVGLCRR